MVYFSLNLSMYEKKTVATYFINTKTTGKVNLVVHAIAEDNNTRKLPIHGAGSNSDPPRSNVFDRTLSRS